MSKALTADGFDDCIIGIGRQFNIDLVVYDQDKIIKKLAKDYTSSCKDCSDECDHYLQAEEYFDANIIGAYVGVNTPVYIVVGNHKRS
jgi:hypothetical protein